MGEDAYSQVWVCPFQCNHSTSQRLTGEEESQVLLSTAAVCWFKF